MVGEVSTWDVSNVPMFIHFPSWDLGIVERKLFQRCHAVKFDFWNLFKNALEKESSCYEGKCWGSKEDSE